MINSHLYTLDTQSEIRKISPKTFWLELEDFEEAQVFSESVFCKFGKINQWKIYLNALAIIGFKKWLKQRSPMIRICTENSANTIDDICYAEVGEFSLCLIIVDNLIDDFVSVPTRLIISAKTVAHFYVLLEVLEEEEQLNIHGFLRYDHLVKYCQSISVDAKSDDCYQLPLSWFDPEVNNLLLYSRFLSATAISLPSIIEVNDTETQNLTSATSMANKALVNLTNWWHEVFEEGWQSTKNIWKTVDNNYNWGYVRSHSLADHSSGIKKIDFGLLLNSQTVALILNLKRLKNNEVDVLVQVTPCYEEHRNEESLPSGLKLKITLNPNTSESESREIAARKADNIIQLEFSEALGKQFQVEVSFKNAVITEDFLL